MIIDSWSRLPSSSRNEAALLILLALSSSTSSSFFFLISPLPPCSSHSHLPLLALCLSHLHSHLSSSNHECRSSRWHTWPNSAAIHRQAETHKATTRRRQARCRSVWGAPSGTWSHRPKAKQHLDACGLLHEIYTFRRQGSMAIALVRVFCAEWKSVWAILEIINPVCLFLLCLWWHCCEGKVCVERSK